MSYMSALIIDGFALAQKIRSRIAREVSDLTRRGCRPCLAVVLAGENPASLSYVSAKKKALAEAGMTDKSIYLNETVSETELLSVIDSLNRDKNVHGILVQLPLPAHIDTQKVIAAVAPEKDADGFHPVNAGNLLIGNKGFVPCTPYGITFMLKELHIPTDGAHAVIVGRSNIVGKPLAMLLARKDINATVTLCHTGTKNLADFTRSADILIAATGKPHTISADMIKPGAAVIDVGVNRIPDAEKKSGFRLIGDVDFQEALNVAGYITPVPKGVGPMTIAMLLQNTLHAARGAVCD